MTDLSHLDALLSRLTREHGRLQAAKTEREIAFRKHEIMMCEREIDAEYRFLGIDPVVGLDDMLDDELLAELTAA